MEQIKRLQTLLRDIEAQEGDSFNYSKEGIDQEYEHRAKENSSIAIKILSIFGGLMASLAFLGFLFILGIYESVTAFLILGIVFVAGAVALNRIFDKLIIDTFCISMYLIGGALVIFALGDMGLHEDWIIVLVMAIALCCLFVTQAYMLSFVSVITISCGFLVLFMSLGRYNFMHAYIAVYSFMVFYSYRAEASFLSAGSKWSKLYGPLRIGLVISLLIGLIALGKRNLIPEAQQYIWLSSIVPILGVLYLVGDILKVLGVVRTKTRMVVYTLSVAVLLPTIFAPSISGAILLMLLSFKVNYKTGLVLGILATIYFVSQYYYDLNFTLLTKSIILFSSGIVFLLFYGFTIQKTRE